MPRLSTLTALLTTAALLAACGTPQEQCINRNTRDLRTVSKLIDETRTNLQRGYAIEEYTVLLPVWDYCPTEPVADGEAPKPRRLCLEDRAETRTRPVAIDLAAESAKLEGLLAKRDQLAAEAEPVIAQCRAQYPET